MYCMYARYMTPLTDPSAVNSPCKTVRIEVVVRRDSERHLLDAVLLVRLIGDPLVEREALKGSDRKRLTKLSEVLGRSDAEHWMVLGARAADAFTKWQLLLNAPR
jgi:hypothetical protein